MPLDGFGQAEVSQRQDRPQEERPAELVESAEDNVQREQQGDTRQEADGHKGEDHANPNPIERRKSSINHSALALALCGWDAVAGGASELIECGACFRRLGLWLYRPKDNGGVTVYNTLNAADEHIEYCPWVNRQAQSGTGRATDKPEDLRNGWELLAQAIKVKHRRQVRATTSTDTLRGNQETDLSGAPSEVEDETRKASDREWWAKVRRIRQVLNIKFKDPNKHKSNQS